MNGKKENRFLYDLPERYGLYARKAVFCENH